LDDTEACKKEYEHKVVAVLASSLSGAAGYALYLLLQARADKSGHIQFVTCQELVDQLQKSSAALGEGAFMAGARIGAITKVMGAKIEQNEHEKVLVVRLVSLVSVKSIKKAQELAHAAVQEAKLAADKLKHSPGTMEAMARMAMRASDSQMASPGSTRMSGVSSRDDEDQSEIKVVKKQVVSEPNNGRRSMLKDLYDKVNAETLHPTDAL